MIINETEKNVLQEYYFRQIDDIACDFVAHTGEYESRSVKEAAEKIRNYAEQIQEIERSYQIDWDLEEKSGREEKEDE